MSCFVHDGNEHCTAFTLSRILLRALKFLILRFSGRLQTFCTGSYGESVFLAAMRSNIIFFGSCRSYVMRFSNSRFAHSSAFCLHSAVLKCISREPSRNTKHVCKTVSCSRARNFGVPFGIHVGGESEENTRYERRIRQRPRCREVPKLGNGELQEVGSFAGFSGDEAAQVVSGAASVG